jgi:hypothetical protein
MSCCFRGLKAPPPSAREHNGRNVRMVGREFIPDCRKPPTHFSRKQRTRRSRAQTYAATRGPHTDNRSGPTKKGRQIAGPSLNP